MSAAALLLGLVWYAQPATFDERFYFQAIPYCWSYDGRYNCRDFI